MSFYEKGNGLFSHGEPTDIKAEMKKGLFIYLGSKKGSKSLDVHLLKDVSINEVCLFPHNKDKPNSYDWINLFFINLQTSEVCSMLIKTYNHGQFKKYLRHLSLLDKSSKKTIDYTTVHTHMEIIEHAMKSGDTGYKVAFYCCKDDKGDWCNGIDEEGNVIGGATVQFLDKSTYENGESFYKENHEGLYNNRVIKEVAEQNFNEYSTYPAQKKKEFRVFLLYKNGFISKDTAGKMLMEAQGQMPENLLA